MQFFTTSKLSENMHETPEGYLVCVGVSIARTGEMVYAAGETPLDLGPDGTVTIQRDAAEVFRPETIASFQAKAVTIQHPSEFVNPQNWSQLSKGILQNVRRGEGAQGNDLVADLLITDSQAIGLVKGGLREVSCGYEADWLQTGVGRGVQKKIIGNHLALVDEGRAGASYAINDHKGKGSVMKLTDRIKAIFAKAQDDALKAATEDAASTEAPKVISGDAAMAGYDEVLKAVKDLGEKVSAMAPKKDEPKPKDASSVPAEGAPAKVVAKDDEVAPGLEERLSKLEAAVSKLLESQAPASDDAEEDDSKVADDGDDDYVAEDEGDEDEEKGAMVGDTASRVEILAPGMKAKGKDVKAKALKTAYATTDGKAIIDQFTAGKAPDFKNEKFVEVLFTAASEILKTSRAKDLSRTRAYDFQSNLGVTEGAMTAEKINELNAKHYATRTSH